MPIIISCDCGKRLRVGDQVSGKKVKCPGCSAILAVPATDEAESSEEVVSRPTSRRKADSPSRETKREEVHEEERRPRKSRPVEAEEQEASKPRKPLPFSDEDKREEERRTPKSRRRRFVKTPDEGWSYSPAFAMLITGFFMMVGAVVWFVVGLQHDFIYFYPPVLFVLGGISFIKGLLGQAE